MSRSRGSDGIASVPLNLTAPGSRTVLCSYGYFSRASMTIGAAALSSCLFRSSLEMRGTGTRDIVVAVSAECQPRVRGAWAVGRLADLELGGSGVAVERHHARGVHSL